LSVLLYNHLRAYVNTFAYGFLLSDRKNGTGQSFTQTKREVYGRCSEIYALYDIAFDPKFPPSTSFCKERAFHYRVAQIIGHSHPSVSQIVKEMTNIGLDYSQECIRRKS